MANNIDPNATVPLPGAGPVTPAVSTRAPVAPVGQPEADAGPVESDSPADSGATVPSVVDTLRKARQNIEKSKTAHFDIPGYGGKLVGEFSVTSWSKLKSIADKAEKSNSPIKELQAHADTLINSLTQLFYREDDNSLTPLNQKVNADGGDGGDEPLDFGSAKLGGIFGFTNTSKTARENLYKLIDNDLGVSAFHNEIALWMQDTTKNSSEQFLGESKGDLK